MPKSQKPAAVTITNVTKKYQVRHEKPTFFDNLTLFNARQEFKALNQVSLTIPKGEKIGIVGQNGSGKTTLLKIISGITQPTAGTVQTVGKIVSLIDLEAGFHPDLSGEENIYLNGLIIGMSKPEIRKQMPAIIRFADIGEFISAPFYTYSQGMKMRLAFAIGVHANPDILVLDEGIVTGDVLFQKKSSAKIQQFFKAKKTIIVVTHWLHYLEEHCQRIVWMEGGQIVRDGGVEVVKAYQRNMLKRSRKISK